MRSTSSRLGAWKERTKVGYFRVKPRIVRVGNFRVKAKDSQANILVSSRLVSQKGNIELRLGVEA